MPNPADASGAPPHEASAVTIHGLTVDDQTRCVHYQTELDIVAIKFACCGRWYPCHACHEASESHAATQWPADAFDERAILCGVCRTTLSIDEYFAATGCPACGSAFNPRCALHRHLYFAAESCDPNATDITAGSRERSAPTLMT
ncbi:MAG TPA: CHY zinc finger protein [Candidatus Lumbricidophila sp.]|nr:CHY zinc finger protein [Candidatus Lumbricidophila sp.]